MTSMPWRERWDGKPVPAPIPLMPFAWFWLMVGLTLIAFANAGKHL